MCALRYIWEAIQGQIANCERVLVTKLLRIFKDNLDVQTHQGIVLITDVKVPNQQLKQAELI